MSLRMTYCTMLFDKKKKRRVDPKKIPKGLTFREKKEGVITASSQTCLR